MQLSVALIWLGALLVLAGLLLTAAKALSRGKLSEPRGSGDALASQTLEPSKPNAGLSLRANWLGIVMIVLGSLLLLGGAVV